MAIRRQETVQLAGFLVREDQESIYVADLQGTWVVRRADIAYIEDWTNAAQCAPEYLGDGRPVRVGISEGATIQEVRPWLVRKEPPAPGGAIRQALEEKVFSLGGTPPPIGERTLAGEALLTNLAAAFARRLGFDTESNNQIRPLYGAAGSATLDLAIGI
jgi:hypothetical protein